MPELDDRLLAACEECDVSLVRELVGLGADVNARGGRGFTPLILVFEKTGEAYAGRQLEIAEFLLENGADMEASNEYRETPLIRSLPEGHCAIARCLIDRGANPDARDAQGFTPLIWASYGGHRDLAEALIGKGVDIDARSELGETSLFLAIQQEHPDIAEFLIEKGADGSIARNDGATPLMMAVSKNYGEIVQSLLRLGADARERDIHGNSAESLALAAKDMGMILLLAKEPRDPDGDSLEGLDASDPHAAFLLIDAAGRNDTEAISRLLTRGVDVNARGRSGTTALHKAARAGALEAVKLLLETGADAMARDDDGKTAMFDAAYREREAVVRLLEARGLSRWSD